MFSFVLPHIFRLSSMNPLGPFKVDFVLGMGVGGLGVGVVIRGGVFSVILY